MLIVDTALQRLQEKNTPIRAGLIGAGFMGRGIAMQICRSVPGIRLVAISNRTLPKAHDAYHAAGIREFSVVETTGELEDNIANGRFSITDNPELLCEAEGIDALIEVTGTVELAARLTLKAIKHGKHVVLMNAEADATVGPVLAHYARKAGVVFTNADGDQPGVEMNLYRFVKSIGVRPVLCGNIKGLHDPYRTPSTQQRYAEQWGQNPAMVTSFADGTKISFEQAIVANGTGMRVGKTGMHGPVVPAGANLHEVAHKLFPLQQLLEGPGIVDYITGPQPAPGVFVLGTHDDPAQQRYLNLYKLGEGPLYLFYTPYHLCHFEAPLTIARAVLFRDAALTPVAGPVVEVVAAAKRDIAAGEVLDGIGGFLAYGLCENHDAARTADLLPMGLAQGCILKRKVAKDKLLTFDDVELPTGRLCDNLWNEQLKMFSVKAGNVPCNS